MNINRRAWGGNFKEAFEQYGYPVQIWMRLHDVSETRAVLDLAEEIEFITSKKADRLRKELGELPRDPEMAQSEAIARGDLVIERSSRNVFWNAECIDADWFKHNESWEFLLISCEHALKGKPVDHFSFGGNVDPNVVAKKKSRLKKQISNFPDDLLAAFQRVGTGTQLFNIPVEKIQIFD